MGFCTSMLRWIDIIKFSRDGNPEPERRVDKSEEEWRQELSEEEFRVTRLKGTEKPYSGSYCRSYEAGQYVCVCCGSLLFDWTEKYNSLSGWPSFTQPFNKAAIKYVVDNSFGMKRVETFMQCLRCPFGTRVSGRARTVGPQILH